MLEPNVTFAILIATLCGAFFHLIVGGDARRLSIYIVASWLGFAIGQSVGTSLDTPWLVIGDLHLLASLVGAFVVLILAWLLSANRRSNQRISRSNR
jgi:uncharacterized membrane protein YjjP (DUF1212 family)